MSIGTALLFTVIGVFTICAIIAWLLTPPEKPPGANIHLEGP